MSENEFSSSKSITPSSIKIRIKLESFDSNLLNLSCDKIIEKIEKHASIVGPVFLPTKRRIYCVLRSPHVNKDSREHFEIRAHRRFIDIYSNSAFNTINSIINIDLPSGVITKFL